MNTLKGSVALAIEHLRGALQDVCVAVLGLIALCMGRLVHALAAFSVPVDVTHSRMQPVATSHPEVPRPDKSSSSVALHRIA